MPGSLTLPLRVRAVLLLGALQTAAGLLELLATLAAGPVALRPWIHLVQIATYGSTGAYLALRAQRDERAVYLGGVLLLTASSFAYPHLRSLESELASGASAASVALAHLPGDAFLPWLLWLFVRDFPRALAWPRSRLAPRVALVVTGLAGAGLLLANALLLAPAAQNLRILRVLARDDEFSHYWTVAYGLVLPAVPFALWKTRVAHAEERRRVYAFLSSVGAAALPVSALILLGALSREFAGFVQSPRGHAVAWPVAQLLVLAIPVVTTYSVVVDRVLDVPLLIRKALQYGLTRAAVALGTAIPFGVAAIYLYARRHETLASVLSGSGLLWLGAALAAGLAALRLRRRATDGIDRLFFRERYDARRILTDLAQSSRDAGSPQQLAALLTREVERALHPESAAVLLADPAQARLLPLSGGAGELELASGLAALAAQRAAPVDLDLEDRASPLRALEGEDRRWVAEGAFQLLVPLLGSDRSLLGLVALGPKRSQLPFSGEDRWLLSTIADSAALALENRLARARLHAPGLPAPEEALECRSCGVVHSSGARVCGACQGELNPAPVPYVLVGKFRFEHRIGAGGMGVAYRALDLTLGRRVAVKTLPHSSPEDSVRLRREARVMAAIVHPNLALIFGAESWRSTPMLIFEFLEGGTLADRLAKEPLAARDAARLGLVLGEVLECIHSAGVLHRDLKPSNVGFTRDGVIKLLDFGVAAMLAERPHAGARPPASVENAALDVGELGLGATRIGEGFVGTPLYMSPEAIWGERPDATFDLWSAAIVVYEGLARRNPVERGTWAESLECITRARIPDVRELRSESPEPLARFLRAALHRECRERPQTAREFRERLLEASREAALD